MSGLEIKSAIRCIIVGAGHAGGSVAAFLRQQGFDGSITLIGDEPIAPYHRPPLSKAWLKGEVDAPSLFLKAPGFYAEQNVDLKLSATVSAIDRAAHSVRLSDGATLPYDYLILATGARARRLPVPHADLCGVLPLRNAADADELKAALGPGRTLVIIGGGYIGLEVAASAIALGGTVTVVEREERVLARVACPALSTFFQDFHRTRGVRFELNACVEALLGASGRVSGVELSDGRVLPCDAVLVGVGAQPNDELAREAGLACDDGIVVDLEARTSDPAIFAIGDVTRRPLPLYGRMVRLESVPNALEQAKQATSAITGRPPPAHEVPWFWSDQYDLKLQIAGLPLDADQTLIRGEPATARFAVFHLRNDVIRAVEAVNAPQEFMAGKMLIGTRKPVDIAKLGDPNVPMKEVAASRAAFAQ